MKFYFFSRKNGFPGNFSVKYFMVGGWEDPDTEKFVGLSGKEILQMKSIPAWLEQEANTWLNWYYYPENTEITEIRTFE